MEKNFEFLKEEHNGKYYIDFVANTSDDEIDTFVKELNHQLRPYDGKAISVGNRIELHFNSEKLQEQMHLVNKFVKAKNKED